MPAWTPRLSWVALQAYRKTEASGDLLLWRLQLGRVAPGELIGHSQRRGHQPKRRCVRARVHPEAAGMWRQGATVVIHGKIAPHQENDLCSVSIVFVVVLRRQRRQLAAVIALLVHLEFQSQAQLCE